MWILASLPLPLPAQVVLMARQTQRPLGCLALTFAVWLSWPGVPPHPGTARCAGCCAPSHSSSLSGFPCTCGNHGYSIVWTPPNSAHLGEERKSWLTLVQVIIVLGVLYSEKPPAEGTAEIAFLRQTPFRVHHCAHHRLHLLRAGLQAPAMLSALAE